MTKPISTFLQQLIDEANTAIEKSGLTKQQVSDLVDEVIAEAEMKGGKISK